MSQGKPRRYIVQNARLTAGTAMAAAALAAVTAFAPAAAAPSSVSATASGSRIDGIHADLARAVALGQVSEEQAGRFEEQLVRRIQSGA
jgi:hypothetical protein